MTLREGKCFQCRGDGYYWRVPDGMNPFAAGGWNTINASYKVKCFRCDGTGRAIRNGERTPVEETKT